MTTTQCLFRLPVAPPFRVPLAPPVRSTAGTTLLLQVRLLVRTLPTGWGHSNPEQWGQRRSVEAVPRHRRRRPHLARLRGAPPDRQRAVCRRARRPPPRRCCPVCLTPEGPAVPIRPENRARYPKDWPTISRTIRFERAAGRCECLGECSRGTHDGRCPNVNGGAAYGTGSRVVLTVAHLDHTPEHCDPANLRAMCQGCHLHYDRDHHRETAAATRRAAIEAAGQLTLDQPA